MGAGRMAGISLLADAKPPGAWCATGAPSRKISNDRSKTVEFSV